MDIIQRMQVRVRTFRMRTLDTRAICRAAGIVLYAYFDGFPCIFQVQDDEEWESLLQAADDEDAADMDGDGSETDSLVDVKDEQACSRERSQETGNASSILSQATLAKLRRRAEEGGDFDVSEADLQPEELQASQADGKRQEMLLLRRRCYRRMR